MLEKIQLTGEPDGTILDEWEMDSKHSIPYYYELAVREAKRHAVVGWVDFNLSAYLDGNAVIHFQLAGGKY